MLFIVIFWMKIEARDNFDKSSFLNYGRIGHTVLKLRTGRIF